MSSFLSSSSLTSSTYYSSLSSSSSSDSSLSVVAFLSKPRRLVISSAAADNNPHGIRIVFNPFQELTKEDLIVPVAPKVSLARHIYVDECESAVNEQINVEHSASYVYHSLYAYFDRDNVSLKGLAKFFKESSEEERVHAEKLMDFQNMRGGRVNLNNIVMPLSEFDHDEKGDALFAMELALSFEKLVNKKLLRLHSVAQQNKDAQLRGFIERELLKGQVEAIKKIAEYVAQLRMVGKGHGTWHFDQMLLHA